MELDKDDRLMSLLDGFLQRNSDGDDSGDVELLKMPADYVEAYVKDLPDSPETPVESVIRSKTETLLDAFIKSSAHGPVISGMDMTADADTVESDNTDFSEQYGVDDEFYTETLARIYLKQHRYDKALEIIRSLYLNFPNKSIYFADQIRYLEKLVRINQKSE